MVNIGEWMKALRDALQGEFGARLLFLGLQGSYRRGEATDASDIDVVAVFDELRLDDLKRYRAVITAMPEGEKACGFICGKEDLAKWPKHELFQFYEETKPYLGDLKPLLPEVTEADVLKSIQIDTANLYHQTCHSYLCDAGGGAEALKDAYKAAFFILQLLYAVREKEYVHTKRELYPRLAGDDLAVLDICMHWQALQSDRAARPEFYYDLLLRWCGNILRSV